MSSSPLIGRAQSRRQHHKRVPCGCCPPWFAPTAAQRRALARGQLAYCSDLCREEGRKRKAWAWRHTHAPRQGGKTARQLALWGARP